MINSLQPLSLNFHMSTCLNATSCCHVIAMTPMYVLLYVYRNDLITVIFKTWNIVLIKYVTIYCDNCIFLNE